MEFNPLLLSFGGTIVPGGTTEASWQSQVRDFRDFNFPGRRLRQAFICPAASIITINLLVIPDNRTYSFFVKTVLNCGEKLGMFS